MKYEGNEVKAAGVLPFKMDGDILMILLRNGDNKGFADFGGKIEDFDNTPLDIALREAQEESNGILTKEKIMNGLLPEPFYIKHAKYVLYFSMIEDVEPKDFGEKETHMDMQHQVQWFTERDYITNLHFRIKKLPIFIKNIKYQLQKRNIQ